MISPLDWLKKRFERLLGIKIYRISLPFGTDLLVDLGRHFDPNTFTVLFDVGATVGQTARSLSERFPRATIYSFEPVAATFEALKANTRELPNVRVFNLAFGGSRTRLPMAVEGTSVCNSFVSPVGLPNPETGAGASVMTDVVTLDDFVGEQGISKIDFLKIDTEGFDLIILKGAEQLLRSGQVDFVQVEIGFHPSTVQVGFSEFLSHLQERGYELFGIYEQQPFWSGKPWLMYANAVFVRRSLWKQNPGS